MATDFEIFGIAFFCIILFWLILCMCPRTQPQEEVQSELSVNVPNQTAEIKMEQMEQDLPPSYSDLYGTELTINNFLKEYVK